MTVGELIDIIYAERRNKLVYVEIGTGNHEFGVEFNEDLDVITIVPDRYPIELGDISHETR